MKLLRRQPGKPKTRRLLLCAALLVPALARAAGPLFFYQLALLLPGSAFKAGDQCPKQPLAPLRSGARRGSSGTQDSNLTIKPKQNTGRTSNKNTNQRKGNKQHEPQPDQLQTRSLARRGRDSCHVRGVASPRGLSINRAFPRPGWILAAE